ncbi:hypothetical protein C1Y35_24620 [Pseudomonas sp. GW456-L14]|uniref:hypothetical protein n=1 Tax=unclassified Pseudomonas TaxID=196821 RepID=UPI000C88E60C|nr:MULTISPECIES: hypothetical protein [unclassified Pseudomonas]PMY34412.1 hypothetical protein C1Y35_24620 [Pseudomonas sp. GW456-L14]PMY58579.1 hypothetical protein C1Y34_05555 [Pseudomonas sp. GW456-L12]
MTTESDKYIRIKAQIEQAYKQTVRISRNQRKTNRNYRLETQYFWFAMISPSVVAVLLAILGKSIVAHWLFNVSWVLIAMSYLALFLYPFVGVLLYRHSLKKVISAPFASLLEWNVKTVMQIDAQYLPELAALSRETLKLGALELKSERSGFEKRTYMVVGALEKVGVFPGFLALFIGISTLIKTLDGAGISARMDWVFAVAVANVFFFFMCGYVQMMLVQYDRMIALTELAIELKKERLESDKAATR